VIRLFGRFGDSRKSIPIPHKSETTYRQISMEIECYSERGKVTCREKAGSMFSRNRKININFCSDGSSISSASLRRSYVV